MLCYLEGLTHEMAAEQLGWPVGSVKSRLAWARERLRVRLTRRGFAPASIIWTDSDRREMRNRHRSGSARDASGGRHLRGALKAGMGHGAWSGPSRPKRLR